MKGTIRRTAFCVLFLLAIAGMTKAQESGTIQAIATVVSSLRVTPVNNLNFGTILPGINKSVEKIDVGFAGEWSVTGTASAEITVDFTLPANLYTADSTAALMIGFSATDASYEDGTGGGQTAPAEVLNPNGPSVRDIGVGGTITIWIGGTVRPTISQTGGDYSADIVLTVAYTGA